MLPDRQSLIRIAALLGAIGGMLAIVVSITLARGSLEGDVTTPQIALFIVTFVLIAVGTAGYFMAGRHENDVNAALGIMLLGASLGAAGPLLMAGEIGVGWILFPLGILMNGTGLLLLGLITRQNPGFLRPTWLPIVLGIAILAMTFAGMGTQNELFWGFAIGVLGAGWVLLSLLLLSGNVRTKVQLRIV